MGVQFKDKDLISETELDDASSVLPIWETEQNKTFKVNPGMLRMQPVAVCNSAAGDNKVATVSNIKGFQLRNGMFITVVFTNGNTADAPTLNINNLGAWPMVCENTAVGSGAYGAGAIITVQYIEVDSSHKYYALVGHNTAKKENGVITQADGDTIYNKQSVDDIIKVISKVVSVTVPSNTTLQSSFTYTPTSGYIPLGILGIYQGQIYMYLTSWRKTSNTRFDFGIRNISGASITTDVTFYILEQKR